MGREKGLGKVLSNKGGGFGRGWGRGMTDFQDVQIRGAPQPADVKVTDTDKLTEIKLCLKG
jgi:hypothetical protein